MMMISGGCLGGTTLHTLTLAPSLCRSPFLLTPLKTLTLTLVANPRRHLLRAPLPSLLRAFSSPALPTASLATQEVKEATTKPQWRAAIDFKWIRDNKDVVAANIKNRNSNADLEHVLELYEKFLSLQKAYDFQHEKC